jgi:type II secretory pathway component PulM
VNLLIAVLTLLLLAIVLLVLSAPLRAARRQPEHSSVDLDELQAAREAKYREIRDAELDYRTGKLSAEDYAAVDSALRAEALDILNRLSALEDEGGATNVSQ